MGLAASQVRYLSLTARKSDLEYQDQMLNEQRTTIASKTADAAKKYAEGMSNSKVQISQYTNGVKEWMDLTADNLAEHGYALIGANGTSVSASQYTTYAEGSSITAKQYANIPESEKEKFTKNEDGTYTASETVQIENESYNGMGIQELLISGLGQIVTKAFYEYLVEHGYGTGVFNDDEGNETTYQKLLDSYNGTSSIDWRSDTTSTFKSANYTEDDAQVLADYEATTAELQKEDKMLECEIKKIETEHKAVETEMDSVKKVIEKNIENSYKTFA